MEEGNNPRSPLKTRPRKKKVANTKIIHTKLFSRGAKEVR
jgi:hypothetical protein